MRYYYKYRSLKSFDHFFDIIINKRLYAAPFTELNDPMEGVYYYFENEIGVDLVEELRKMKESLKICSLSKNYTCSSMWTHYADNHKGVVLEIQMGSNENIIQKDIIYSNDSIFLKKDDVEDDTLQSSKAEELLSKKLKSWKAEQEVRIFLKTHIQEPQFINVKVKKIYTGVRMNEYSFNVLSHLINQQNEMRDEHIEIRKMNIKDLK